MKKAKLRFKCRGCRKQFEDRSGVCPVCGGSDVQIISGREVKLLAIEVEDGQEEKSK